MLKTVLASLLVGLLVVVVAALTMTSFGREEPSVTNHSWRPDQIRVVTGERLAADRGIQLQLTAAGRGVVEVAANGADLEQLPILHIRFKAGTKAQIYLVTWRTTQSGDAMFYRQVAVIPGNNIWLNITEEQSWSRPPVTIGIVFLGPPGDRIPIEAIELTSPVFPYNLLTAISSWTAFSSWQHNSINRAEGVTPIGSRPFPVAAAAALLLASTLAYLAQLGLAKSSRPFQWRVPAALFMCCWLALDMLWQGRLLQQLSLTRETFAGRSTAQKREAGIDRDLYRFVSRVKGLLPTSGPRIFVDTAQDYTGMRGAYYLYPANVFWQRYAGYLPAPSSIHRGDYVVLLNPARARYNERDQTLEYGRQYRLSVELLLSDALGGLYRVN